MRILHLLEATRGGTRRHVLDLLPAQQAAGLEPCLVYSTRRNADFAADACRLQQQGIEVLDIPMARQPHPLQDARALRALAEALVSLQPDLIHCHSTKAGLLGRLLRFGPARHIPLVYTPHCIAFATRLPLLQRRAARWTERWLAPLTTHYIAVSQHEHHLLLATGLAHGNSTVIHNGLNLPELDALFGLPAELPETEPVIGCFGRLTAQKNQAALIRALGILRRSRMPVQLWLVGSGEDEARLRQLATTCGVADQVQWWGDLPEARSLYPRCQVIAQPSRWEGCPYSVLEAMAARRPVLAGAVGGVREIVTPGTGLLAGDSAGLASELARLCRDRELREQLGTAARARVEQHFCLDQMVQATIAVYQHLLS